MMTVQDVLDIAKLKLNNNAISRNENALIKFIYLGVSELFNRFNLSIKSETVRLNENLAMYSLRNDDVSMLLNLYNREGTELKQSDIINGRDWDYKIINYKSFLLNKPVNGLLYAVYKASPIVLQDGKDIIDLPDAMIDALLSYICYMGCSTINRDNMDETSKWLQAFDKACMSLEMQGYKIPLNTETLGILVKGYV